MKIIKAKVLLRTILTVGFFKLFGYKPIHFIHVSKTGGNVIKNAFGGKRFHCKRNIYLLYTSNE